MGARKGGGPNFRAFFSLSRHCFHSFLPLSGVLSLNVGGVFEGRDPEMCTFGLSGCRVKPQQRPPGSRRDMANARAEEQARREPHRRSHACLARDRMIFGSLRTLALANWHWNRARVDQPIQDGALPWGVEQLPKRAILRWRTVGEVSSPCTGRTQERCPPLSRGHFGSSNFLLEAAIASTWRVRCECGSFV